MEIKLQKANIDDWQEILSFEKAAACRVFHAMTVETEIKDFLKSNLVFFVVANDQKIGVIGYEAKKDTNYISELIIGAEFRGKGYGSKVLEELLKMIGNKVCELHTHPENTGALIVYLKSGFKIKKWIDDCYGDGEPRILLVREK